MSRVGLFNAGRVCPLPQRHPARHADLPQQPPQQADTDVSVAGSGNLQNR